MVMADSRRDCVDLGYQQDKRLKKCQKEIETHILLTKVRH